MDELGNRPLWEPESPLQYATVGDEPESKNVLEAKTGTTTLGMTTDDGVVLATDTRVSLGRMVSSKDHPKVEQVHPTAALTVSGSVSGSQALVRSLRAEVNLYEARRGERMSMDALATLVGRSLQGGGFRTVPLLGGVDAGGPRLFSLDGVGGVMEQEYAATGSGTQFVYGVLERRYEPGLSTDEAREVAVDAVLSATERDTASGNGLVVAEITADGVDIIERDLPEAR